MSRWMEDLIINDELKISYEDTMTLCISYEDTYCGCCDGDHEHTKSITGKELFEIIKKDGKIDTLLNERMEQFKKEQKKKQTKDWENKNKLITKQRKEIQTLQEAFNNLNLEHNQLKETIKILNK